MQNENNKLIALVVEDNQDFAQLVCDILHIQGCTPHVAYRAEAALTIARNINPDIVFCDLGLPGDMNGLDFARSMRADASLRSIPLVAITGYTSEQDKAAAMAAGFNMVFPKPFKFVDLTNAIAQYARRD
ncbi:response regulator [Noviherbaspirillum malthae]|jgi:CheY-like chemotaxis protein|uniref:response regulator n=1 Tax=Noviherbaspirillum malthae TaxID=1260987 RepID=UPI001890427C|nr:response regulator [Noviherbaspirillum malthae]